MKLTEAEKLNQNERDLIIKSTAYYVKYSDYTNLIKSVEIVLTAHVEQAERKLWDKIGKPPEEENIKLQAELDKAKGQGRSEVIAEIRQAITDMFKIEAEFCQMNCYPDFIRIFDKLSKEGGE